MRQTFRRFTAAGLLLTLLALAGCSAGGAVPNSGGSPAGGKSVDLTFMTWMSIGSEATQAVVEAYTSKHPNVHITLKDFQKGELMTMSGGINTAMLDGIDVALVPSDMADRFQQAGALKDLSNLRLPAVSEAVAPLIDDLGKAGGKRYGVPISLTPQLMHLNEQALTQAGIKLPAQDWSLQEFEQFLTALKGAGLNMMVPTDALVDPILHAYGAQLYDPAKQLWPLDTREAKQGLAEVAKLVQAQLVTASQPGHVELGGKGAPALIAPPPGAMFQIGGVSLVPQPLPRGPKGRGTPVSAVEAVVNASSANADVAADFVRFLLADPTAQQALAKAGIRPVSADSAALAAWRQSVGDRTAQVTDLALQGAFVEPALRAVGNFDQVVQILTNYFNGSVSYDQMLPSLMNAAH